MPSRVQLQGSGQGNLPLSFVTSLPDQVLVDHEQYVVSR